MIRILSLATLLAVLSAASAQTVTIGGSVTIGEPQRVVRYHYSPSRYVVETSPARYNDYRYTTRYDYRYRYDTYRNDGVIRDAGRDYAYDRVRNVRYTDPYYERVYYNDSYRNNSYRTPDGTVIRIQIHP